MGNQFFPLRKYFFLLLLPAALLYTAANPAEARSYDFPRLQIEAEILADGSMTVIEERTVSFKGTYSGLYQWIYKDPGVEIVDIRIFEGSTPFAFNPQSTYGPPGTFFVTDSSQKTYIDWSISVTDEERTYRLEYRVLNQVKVHEDVAELYYQFVGSEWEVPTGEVTVRLILPSPGASYPEFRVWGHGPLHGEAAITGAAEATWRVSPLPAGSYLEGRVVFPRELVPECTNLTGKTALPDILAAEEELANQANRERWLNRMDWLTALLLFSSAAAAALICWLRFGKKFRPAFQGDYYREPPADYGPAVLALLWRYPRPPDLQDLTATIVDLARRRHLTIEEISMPGEGQEEEPGDFRLTLKECPDPLDDYERLLLDFLFKEVAAGTGPVSFNQIKRFSTTSGEQFYRFWKRWRGLLLWKKSELGFLDERSPGVKTNIRISGISVFAVGIMLLIVCLAFSRFSAAALAFLPSGMVLLTSSFFYRRYSRRGEEELTLWKAFRRFLLDFSEIPRHELPALAIWEQYLVYAITLGVAREVIRQLNTILKELGGYIFGAGWLEACTITTAAFEMPLAAAPTALLYHFETSIASLARDLHSAYEQSFYSISSSASSGEGGGGGFSGGSSHDFGGGSFGGGGGGGGAR